MIQQLNFFTIHIIYISCKLATKDVNQDKLYIQDVFSKIRFKLQYVNCNQTISFFKNYSHVDVKAIDGLSC